MTQRRWHAAPGERTPLAAAAATYFLLLCGYYMLRSLREATALEAGRENIPPLFTLTFVAMLVILRGALAGPAFNAFFVEQLGATAVIYIACALLAGAVLAGMLAQALRAKADAATATDASVAVGGRAIDDLARLARSPYLLGIADLASNIFAAADADSTRGLAHHSWRSARDAHCDVGRGRCLIRDTGVVPGRRAASHHAGDSPRRRLRPVQAGARDAFHRSVTGRQVQEQESARHVLQRGSDSLGNGLYPLVAGFGLAAIAGLCAAACVLLIMAARWLGAASADQETRASRPH